MFNRTHLKNDNSAKEENCRIINLRRKSQIKDNSEQNTLEKNNFEQRRAEKGQV